jgi:hypothetical protein
MTGLRKSLTGVALAALLLTTTTALAGSGVGGVFNLGQTNSVTGTSTLTGDTAAPQLTVKNTSTNTSATALNLSVAAGRTPFKVNSPVKVANLNADQLDGKDSTAFYAAGSKVVNADKLDGQDSAAFLGAGAKAADADKLDGRDSAGFWNAGGNAGTTPGTDFLGTTDNQPLELKVDGQRALRLEPASSFGVSSPDVIGGFSGNAVTGSWIGTTIAGGGVAGSPNTVTGHYAAVGGGRANSAGPSGTVSGGSGNSAGSGGSVGGGTQNSAGDSGTVAGGASNTASGVFNSSVGGGYNNTASGHSATVAGGLSNVASGDVATAAGGNSNTASGDYSTVAGGSANTASGVISFAAGYRAKANDAGSFVWGDSSEFDVSSYGADTFTARTTGGARFVSGIDPTTGAPTAGVYIAPGGGSWGNLSDRAVKRGFVRVDRRQLLKRLDRVPIARWGYKAQDPSIRHLGPTAQDFRAAFGLGEDGRHIDTVDSEGVALAAIQGLYRENRALARKNQRLDARLMRLERALQVLSKQEGRSR